MMITALGVGFITPPLGLNLFVVSGITGESILKNRLAGGAFRLLHADRRAAHCLCSGAVDHAAARHLQICPTPIHRRSGDMSRIYLKKAQKTASTDSGSRPRHRPVDPRRDRDRRRGGRAALCGKNSTATPATSSSQATRLLKPPRNCRKSSRTTSASPMTMSASFAEAQKGTLSDVEVEIVPGLTAGQKDHPDRGRRLLCSGWSLQPCSPPPS